MSLAKLEGRNGIGKSLAARLLELVAGEPPYVGLPLAWSSLVEQLGVVNIQIDDIGSQSISVRLDSSEWDPNNQLSAVANPGEVRIDGEPASWEEIRSILQVRRIAGDETLSETIGLALFQTAKDVETERMKVSEITDAWSKTWDKYRFEVDDPANRAHSLIANLNELAATRSELIRTAQDTAQRSDAIEATLESLRTLARIADSQQLNETYEQAWAQRNQLEQRIAKAEAKLLEARGSRDPGAQGDFEQLTRRVRLRRDAHTRAQFDQNTVLRALDLDSRPDMSGIRRLLSDAQERRLQLRDEQKTLFAAGTIRDAAGSLERTLLELPSDLHREVVAELDHDVTVGELARGLGRRRENLRDVPKSEAVLRIEAEIKRNDSRISLLSSVGEVMRVADRKRENLEEIEAALERFFEASASDRAEREALLDDLAEQRDQLVRATSDALSALLGLRAAAGLESVAGNADRLLDEDDEDGDNNLTAAEEPLDQRLIAPSELRAEVDNVVDRNLEIIGRHGVVAVDERWSEKLPTLLEQTTVQLDDCSAAQRQIVEELSASTQIEEEVRVSIRSLRSDLATFVDSLLAGEDRAELREAAETWLGNHGTSLRDLPALVERMRAEPYAPTLFPHEESALELAAELRELADRLEDAASTVRDRWGLAAAFIIRESHELSPRLVHTDTRPWQFLQLDESGRGRILRTWVEAEVSHLLSQDVLRRELFENAADVEYDLTARSVIWRSEEGKRRRRPLEAFSSGEQVFAYTRAKLESLRALKDQAKFVLIFLDEFGAFVARDRFGQLMRYVQTDVLGTIADQVVVMLPNGDTDTEFEARMAAAEFVGHDYVVESLVHRAEAG
ncbi:hypothetical protein [Microbacterium sp. A1-JK]|uniref:hypothetical protein n=1 Tax=Microbacterium sp. A1-JK TaxID=3177516 RepID=UPI0038889C6D